MNTHAIVLSVVACTVGIQGMGFAQESKPAAPVLIPAGADSLPSNAKPGKCYARAWQDPTYRTVTEKVLRREAGERVHIIPAKYTWVEEKVLVREAYQKAQVVPPKYETVSEKVLVKPAFTRWKKGRGLIEKVDNFTGEIMCLEEVPAEYKTVKKQVLRAPGTTKVVQVPAEYKVVKVKKLVSAAQEKRIPIAAEYETVTKTVKESEGRMVWQEVLCETNAPQDARRTAQPVSAAIHAQSRGTSATAHTVSQDAAATSEKDWFFFWDWNELFEKPTHRFVPASK